MRFSADGVATASQGVDGIAKRECPGLKRHARAGQTPHAEPGGTA